MSVIAVRKAKIIHSDNELYIITREAPIYHYNLSFSIAYYKILHAFNWTTSNRLKKLFHINTATLTERTNQIGTHHR